MRFDWTISMGNILTLAVFIGGIIRLNWFIGRMMQIMKDFPPHRHGESGGIIYPSGMRPDGS